MTTHASTWRAIQTTSSVIATEHDQQDVRKIGPRPEVDHALGRHLCSRGRAGRSIVSAPPDVLRWRRAPALNPVIEHASLPSGGSVTVWVGVPDDPYIDDKGTLNTVDIQLHEGNDVIASLRRCSTRIRRAEALALAREVKAAIEAERIGLHANELEPFADRLR